ncbi:alanine racemase [Persicimonas caeni]|uniref:Multifunctional fusion protein n=1 Tax=Persicimonas caeni TaxID=2292766 RepID=A0A4Y6PTI8_PERCE|nr:alanine racemase [Persicimonas caeni]QDG51644.1 alanine racemase [Persicimonas caeni]QED32865.1 alanine racemase [Persicimonas caeni]
MSQSPQLTLEQIARLTGGELLCGDADLVISEIGTDSRAPFAQNSLFVALDGEHFDGHRFITEASEKGAAAALVSHGDPLAYPDVALIRVDDTLEALQRLAASWRGLFDVPVVGITGSNGKTIVKDMLASILAQEQTVFRSPGSYNSQIGVPLSLLGIRPEHDIAVIEAGISRIGEMERLEPMIRPTLGIITNIGLAHAAGLNDLATTAREKLELFANLDDRPLIYPAESKPLGRYKLPGTPVSFAIAPGKDAPGDEKTDADYLVERVAQTSQGFAFSVQFPDGAHHPFALNVPGRHNLANAAAAIAAADTLGVSVEAIREGLAAFELSPLRLEMHTTQEGVTFINDAYSSDPVSARAALSVLEHYAGQQRAIAILGDMLDLGARSTAAHRQLGQVVAHTGIDRLICYGERAQTIGKAAQTAGMTADHIDCVDSIDTLHDLLERELRSGDVVLFKASRTMGLERAAERLLESVAPARLYIDLNAIRDNYHAIRRHVGDGTGLIAVVKSFGYGNDSTRVSQTLAREGVDALAVAYADEGIPLRKRGLTLPILVTNALASEADKLVKYDLTPLVYSRGVVDALRTQARRFSKRVHVHLEVDTGMNRVGLKPDETLSFARELAAIDEIVIEGLMTHFAAADDPDEDAFTRQQIDTFKTVLDQLHAEGIHPNVVHAANTAGAWRFPDAHFDRVRVGLGLYGLSPTPAVSRETDGTHAALAFTTRIIHLKDVAAGETVGYNRTWTAEQPRTIATIAAGYNDGFPRFMSNGGEVLIGGRRCPVVGNVCMDVSMVDVTDVPNAKVGDEVVIFGHQGSEAITVDEIAGRGGTISYELLCNISPRVRRIFVRQ